MEAQATQESHNMAAQIPVKAIYSGSDVTSLGEFASSDSITATYLPVGTGSSDVAAGDHTHAYLPLAGGALTGALTTNSTIDGVDIAARDAVLTSTATTASAALPKAGGAMTGAITTNSTFDGVDIATRDGVLTSTTTTANAALPKAGGALTGHTTRVDNVISKFGTGDDLQIYHDGSHSYVADQGTGSLRLAGSMVEIMMGGDYGETAFKATDNGSVELYHDNTKKIETTANGITVTGEVRATSLASPDGTDILYPNNNGKIGIGTASTPAAKLEVTGNVLVVQVVPSVDVNAVFPDTGIITNIPLP